MSLIFTELYDALIEAGASEKKARAAAAAMPDFERLATKDDLAEVKAELRAEIVAVRSESKQDKAELKQDIADLRREVAVTKFGTFTMGPAILALLLKLTFFP